MIKGLRNWRWRGIVSAAITVLVLLLFIYTLFQQWQAGRIYELQYPIGPMLFSALGMFALAFLLGLFWCWILSLTSGKAASIRPLLYVHFVSWLARYVPGKIGQVVGKVVLGENMGYRRGALLASVFYENAFFIGSGISTALFCLGSSPLIRILSPVFSEQWIAIAAFVLVIGLLSSVILLPKIVRRLLKREEVADRVISARVMLLLFLSYHLAHVVAGLGFYFLLMLLVPQNSVPLVVAIGILTTAHVGGVLAFIVPVGLGVREPILFLLLTPYMPTDQAVVVSLITRIWSTVADGYVLAAIPVIGLNLDRYRHLR